MNRHSSLEDRFDPAIRIVEHDAGWGVRAREEIRRIELALGPVALRLEHVGSTAVPGLAARPIVDLQLSVAAIEPRAVRRAARAARLRVRPHDESPDYLFFAKPAERPPLALPARLRARERARAAHHPQDRLAYIAAKDEYLARLEQRAVSWARGRVHRARGPFFSIVR